MPNVTAPAAATAASQTTPIPGANPAGAPVQVSAVYYRPAANVTGQNTNTRLLRLRNATTTTDVATLQLNAGVNLTANRWTRIPLVLAPPVAAAVAAQTLQWESNAVGTGLADPGGTVRIVWTRELAAAARTVTDAQGRAIVTPPELALDVDAPHEPTEVG